ncbi:uracil-DNA glycosylase [Clostridium sp.]|uniref:uracil-DNA glycosylase n=1 Tax=Clostridium sp. TaxID=1506 RepID=UPI003D6D8DE7
MNIEEELRATIKNITENYKDELTSGWIAGNGPIPTEILFIGESPGRTEVEQGIPFVGMTGKTFEEYLNSIELKKSDIRITNVCYFRPIKIKQGTTGNKSVSNRTPTPLEVDLFREVLDKEIAAVNPKIIVTLGNTPLRRFTESQSIGRCHGLLMYSEKLDKYVFPMYHPSALTYNRTEDFLQTYKNDWNKLKRALRLI